MTLRSRHAYWLALFVLMTVLVLHFFMPETTATAQSARFDYIYVISPVYLYQGQQGILLLDRRNGNVWFIAKGNNTEISFQDPVFVVRLPLEKIDQTAR